MYSSFQCRLLSLVSFLTLRRTRKFIPPPWYKGGAASYPDVSLSMKMCAHRKAGRRRRDVASPAVCTLPMVPCGSLPIARNYFAKNEVPEEKEAEGGGWGSWMEPLPEVFGMLQYFETILPLVESL